MPQLGYAAVGRWGWPLFCQRQEGQALLLRVGFSPAAQRNIPFSAALSVAVSVRPCPRGVALPASPKGFLLPLWGSATACTAAVFPDALKAASAQRRAAGRGPRAPGTAGLWAAPRPPGASGSPRRAPVASTDRDGLCSPNGREGRRQKGLSFVFYASAFLPLMVSFMGRSTAG